MAAAKPQKIRRAAFKKKSRSLYSFDAEAVPSTAGYPTHCGNGDAQVFLQIKPAIGERNDVSRISGNSNQKEKNESNTITLAAIGEGKVQLFRNNQDKERYPDRICLDRRGLSTIPKIVNEPDLRLLSLQHNLICSLSGINKLELSKLVFLDLYNNQIDKISSIEKLISLRVLLLGKNRIKKIDGFIGITKLEVLDLHGNRISKVSGLSTLGDLKVLNLAGNCLKTIGPNDLQGLSNLRELNVKKNKLKQLQGFEHTPNLEKLFLSNNELQSVESMTSLSALQSLTEITLDANPIAMGGDCIPYLVAYLPNLLTLSSMPVTDQVRQAALTWRQNKETSDASTSAAGAIGSGEQTVHHRDQVIQNARANWELLRSDLKQLTSKITEIKAAGYNAGQTQSSSHITNTTIEIAMNKRDKRTTKYERPFRSVTAKMVTEKRVNFSERSASLDTEASHSTSTSSDIVKLPPILLPIINSLENAKITEQNDVLLLKRCDSISSIEPAVDSSASSITSESESDEEVNKVTRLKTAGANKRTQFGLARSKTIAEIQARPKTSKDDSSSNLSTATNANSNSSTEMLRPLRRHNSLSGKSSKRSAKSAISNARKNDALPAGRAATAKFKSKAVMKKEDLLQKPPPKERHIANVVGLDGTSLCICGADAVRRIDAHHVAEEVISANFEYLPYATLTNALTKLKTKFPNVSHITFRANGLQYLGQLHALAELRGLRSLTIAEEGNPIEGKKWREYAIYRLAHWGLRVINSEEISETEIHEANTTYSGLSDMVIRALPDEPLAPLVARMGKTDVGNSSGWIRNADPALRSVVAKEALQWRKGHLSQEDMNCRARGLIHLNDVVDTAINTTRKLRILELEWDGILVETIEATLKDFRDMRKHVNDCMMKLSES